VGGCLLNFISQRAIRSPVNLRFKAMNVSISVHFHSELNASVDSSQVVQELFSFSHVRCQNTEMSFV